MQLVIYKYKLDVVDASQLIQLPEGAKILTVALQGSYHQVWVIQDTTKPLVNHFFHCVGTGYKTDNIIGEYISTTFDGPFVWHWFYN